MSEKKRLIDLKSFSLRIFFRNLKKLMRDIHYSFVITNIITTSLYVKSILCKYKLIIKDKIIVV